jgi:SAM-dependent methyltransferase/glycosyltransferase involved in cell wall biosynthesis
MAETYKREYSEPSVYSHVVSLLPLNRSGPERTICLDLGCGYGAIAPAVQSAGYHYVGIDSDLPSVESLRKRGFEAWIVDLLKLDSFAQNIQIWLNNRQVSVICIIDVLEHLPNPGELISLLARTSKLGDAPLVVSVPNFSHRDVSVKLLSGRFDITEAGILDHTHLQCFTEQGLLSLLHTCGYRQDAKSDYHLTRSDQHFPSHDPLVSYDTPIGDFLSQLRNFQPNGTVNQLVRRFAPISAQDKTAPVVQKSPLIGRHTPFFSVIMRTQGRRPSTFWDALLCLAAQTDQDFELVIVFHGTEKETFDAILTIVNSYPQDFRNKVRLVQCTQGLRSAPLNIGLSLAQGVYFVCFDDDDLVMANWLEQFRHGANKKPGSIVRAVAVEQRLASVLEEDSTVMEFKTVSGLQKTYPTEFNLLAHFRQNYSPFFSLAFPTSFFNQYGFKFDEALNSAEDWDFLTRVVTLCGVEQCLEITGVYRKWTNAHSSATEHDQAKWKDDYSKILAKRNSNYILLPPGSAIHLLDLLNTREAAQRPSKMQRLFAIYSEDGLGGIGSLIAHKFVIWLRRAIAYVELRIPFFGRILMLAYYSARRIFRQLKSILGK